MIPWHTITGFGDMTVTGLALIAITAWLLLSGERRLTVWWVILNGIGLFLITASKMAFIGWGLGIAALDFTGFSGHAARAMAVFPVLLYLFCQRMSPTARFTAMAAGFAFGTLISYSRIVVHAHSPSEVVTGWLLGLAISITFIRMTGMLQKCLLTRGHLALGFLLAFTAASAEPAPTQSWLTRASLYISGHDTPYVRIASGEFRRLGTLQRNS
ncbi:PAP2 superfamily protein [Noviherbaspirillum humi]|uniref:PAP2 superfamily protein n=1 Tax=Noviherbaspirillum humi TaxID=1688639 RepID=A0A239CCG3_9BURK|nr:phosphatase PAP2 family protein [Noviherbaspirillum humi]SNS17582.1 PAP2 superfamily protein [Noviherbaspirillum humi]